MVRRLWKIAVVLALLVLVASGAWAWLYATVDPSSAATARVVAIGAAIVLAVGILARGQRGATLAKARQVIGAVGLFLDPRRGRADAVCSGRPADDPMVRPADGAGAARLDARGRRADRAVVARHSPMVRPDAGVRRRRPGRRRRHRPALDRCVGSLGLDPDLSGRVAFGLALASIGAVLFAWARGRRDRQALGGAIGRAAFGRANPGDIALLAAGPGPILRRRSTSRSSPWTTTREAPIGMLGSPRSMPRWPIPSPAARQRPAGGRPLDSARCPPSAPLEGRATCCRTRRRSGRASSDSPPTSRHAMATGASRRRCSSRWRSSSAASAR